MFNARRIGAYWYKVAGISVWADGGDLRLWVSGVQINYYCGEIEVQDFMVFIKNLCTREERMREQKTLRAFFANLEMQDSHEENDTDL